MSKGLAGIDTVFVEVGQLDQALLWYRDKLGFAPSWRDNFIASLNPGGPTMLTLVQRSAIAQPHPRFNFFAADLEAAHADLLARGAMVGPIRDYGTVRTFDLYDPDDNILNVCTY